MKKMSLFVVALVVLYSCQKSNITGLENSPVKEQENSIPPLSKEKKGLCVENNVNTLSNTNGEWSCPSPAKDCGKISPCSAISGGGNNTGGEKLQVADLSELDAAINSGSVTEYIGTPQGANFFKRLLSGKGDLFSQLSSGTLTVVKRVSTATGNAYYLVVDAKTNGTVISAKDVLAAYEFNGK